MLTVKYNIRFGLLAAILKLTGKKKLGSLISKSWSVSHHICLMTKSAMELLL